MMGGSELELLRAQNQALQKENAKLKEAVVSVGGWVGGVGKCCAKQGFDRFFPCRLACFFLYSCAS